MTVEITDPEPPKISPLWECVDPCAFLCYSIQISAIPFDGQVKKTLDAFGWLTPEGFPDYALMTREFEKIR